MDKKQADNNAALGDYLINSRTGLRYIVIGTTQKLGQVTTHEIMYDPAPAKEA